MRTKSRTLPLGTISEGTLNPDDLIPAYLDVLEDLRLSRYDRKTVRLARHDYEQWANRDDDAPNEYAAFTILEDLTQILESHCPDYAYFGSHECDGACIGVWPSINSLEECVRFNDGVVKIDAGDPFPITISQPNGHRIDFVMSVTDHGNVTLYRRAGNRWIEVWSVV